MSNCRRYIAAAVFIAEGVAILFFPDRTLTAFCRRHRIGQYLLNGLLDFHWDDV